ncbi:helix-turn-helix domain-containing protein [Agrobacterium rhizogenes]|nr:helix-turn-helix domain-containing protein [Rhizobium rhizogenes]NTJ83608.1 helix-turn-helix domain-containing protein [Rhizobium rhizogenes]
MAAPKGNRYAAGNKGGGRKSTYKPEYAPMAAKACQFGATNFELGQMFGVSSSTIIAWTHEHHEFSEAVTCGKDKADERVARSLFNRAVGYSYESEKVFSYQGDIVRAEVVEHVPPDPGAAMNWLKNRRPGEWRDKIDHVHGVTGEVATLLESLNGKTRGLPSGS